jgi:DNA topoisomerase VI subunit A
VNEIINLEPFGLFPTIGPLNRYKYALFIEKEGFGPLLAAGQISEKYDLLLSSSKGLSVTALRQLLDELHKLGVGKVFVLHDFDISGFSILGTLGTSNRRYRFENPIQVVDLGLRLVDVQNEELQSEPIRLERMPPNNKKDGKPRLSH